MAVLYDARGNEVRTGFPDTVTNEVVTDARVAAVTLSALNAEVIMDLNGAETASFDVRTGAASLTFVFEATVDGTNYFAIPALTVGGTLFSAASGPEHFVTAVVVTTTLAATYTIDTAGYRRVRVRVSAFTSGSVVVAARGTVAGRPSLVRLMPSLLAVQIDGAANAITTITLPAPAAGLFHYITHISWMRHSTAALVGTGAFAITSTNLPGALKWRVGNAIAVGEHRVDVVFSPVTPLKSSASGTATTIVAAAAGAAVLTTGLCTYYVGA